MKGSSYNQKLNNIMRGSACRSRFGLGVSNWDFPSLGGIEIKVLGDFIQKLTHMSENAIIDAKKEESIVYIDVEELESNPNNFYGLRNIDELTGLIAVSHFIEPLTIFQKSDGKFKIFSGHRRCAAVKKLLES